MWKEGEEFYYYNIDIFNFVTNLNYTKVHLLVYRGYILFLRINFIANSFILNEIIQLNHHSEKITNKKNEVYSLSYCSSYLVHIVVGCKRHVRINPQIKMDYHRFRSFHHEHPSPSASNLNIDRLELLQLTTVPFVSFWTLSAATPLHFSLFNIPLSFTGNVQTIGRKQTESNRSEKFPVWYFEIWY